MESLPGTVSGTTSEQTVDRDLVPWRFPTGEWAFLAGNWRVFFAAAIDGVPVLGAGAIQYLVVMGSIFGTQQQGLVSAILVSAVVAWGYGFLCFSGNTLGTLACGTRMVKLRDGSAPGMWRGGWLMFVRTIVWVLCPIAPPLASVNANDKNVPGARRFHISIRKAQIQARGSAAEFTQEHGTANERFKPPVPSSTLAAIPMDNYHPHVPSQFKDGSWGVQPRIWRILLAWLIDLALVILAAAASAGALLGETAPTGADITGCMVFFTMLLSWAYGFCCASGNSIGTLVLDTRIVRLANAASPGFWRGGWIMFYRVVLGWVAPLMVVAGWVNGNAGDGDMHRILHVSIDKRRTSALHAA